MSNIVRRFRLADLTRILKIEAEAFEEDAYTREMFFELRDSCPGLFLVAIRGGHVAGYIVAQAEGHKAEIISIAIGARHRGKGLGKALLQTTIEKLKALGVRRVDLAVRPSNRPALRLYRSFGFLRAGRVRRYYADGSDALKMRLRIGLMKIV